MGECRPAKISLGLRAFFDWDGDREGACFLFAYFQDADFLDSLGSDCHFRICSHLEILGFAFAGDEKSFFEALGKVGIETKTKNLQIFSGGAKKADWDVGLAVDAIKLAPKLDSIILVTGDGDFIPLVEYLQVNEGCQVEVMSFGRSSSSKLIEVADDFIDLDQNPRKYLLGFREMRNRRDRNENQDSE
jgi:uncharacterized LabA/DUF88 family protein